MELSLIILAILYFIAVVLTLTAIKVAGDWDFSREHLGQGRLDSIVYVILLFGICSYVVKIGAILFLTAYSEIREISVEMGSLFLFSEYLMVSLSISSKCAAVYLLSKPSAREYLSQRYLLR